MDKPDFDIEEIPFDEFCFRIRQLCAEMIKIAMNDYVSFKRQLDHINAYYWIAEERSEAMFTFNWCCDYLQLNRNKIRTGILWKRTYCELSLVKKGGD